MSVAHRARIVLLLVNPWAAVTSCGCWSGLLRLTWLEKKVLVVSTAVGKADGLNLKAERKE